MARSNFDNPIRRLQTPGGDRDISSLVTDPSNRSGSRIATAVVVDFISNPKSLSSDILDSLKKGVQNPDFVDKMPRNSVLAYVVPDDKIVGKPSIFYPFFSPHLGMPVKAGEQIWVIYDDPAASLTLGYWICRKATDLDIDDLNYTHLDRVGSPKVVAGAAEQFEKGVESILDFPPGGPRGSDSTLPLSTSYEKIVGNSIDYANFVGEVVPRYSRSGSDLVLQGSNNALICLGRDFDILTTINAETPRAGSGTIDLVVGRGSDDTTAAPAATNSRNYPEVDKSKAGPEEGSRSLLTDKARVFIGAQADPDALTQNAMQYWDSIGLFGTQREASEGSFALVRGKNLRFIASDNGSIMLLRDSSSGEGMIVDESGNIRILGQEISLGSSSSDQPYIRYDEYRKTIESIVGVIRNIASTLGPIATAAGSAPLGSGVASVATALASAVTWTGLDITAPSAGYLDKCKSSIISGE
jgi:hypothetical protein